MPTLTPRPEDSAARRALVRSVVLEAPIRTQAELVAHLQERGHAVTQSCVSRDLRDLGVRKIGGRYRIAAAQPGLAELQALVEGFAPAGPHLVVIRTLPGGAQRVAHAIDSGDWPEAAGSVAGDDTIFVASHTAADQQRVLARLRDALGQPADGSVA